jgi:membrane-associated phospholipid phosphatase
MTELAVGVAVPTVRPLRRALLWLAGLAPFFYLTYGFANWATAQRADVPAVVFAWEGEIPFLAWTIFPYWSINAFYGLSLLVCRTPRELDTHGRRLLTAQVVAVACFLVFPLRFTWPKPEATGAAGFMFDTLASFDQPFNQAPSLHIALLVILWVLYARRVPKALLWPMHAWFALIGISVLTTWQHHFIDIPTGALLGLFCLWLWPDEAAGRFAWRLVSWRRALTFAVAAIALAAIALAVGGATLWLLWPAVSLGLLAAAYAGMGPAVFQKGRDGQVSLAARLLLAPYRLAAWINSRAWTWTRPADSPVATGVSLGRFPTAASLLQPGYRSVIDLAAELVPPRVDVHWTAFPVLDRVTPDPTLLAEAAKAVEAERRRGGVLVCCALGYARSAAAVATWLIASGRATGAAGAIDQLRTVRPGIAIDAADKAAIDRAAALVGRIDG